MSETKHEPGCPGPVGGCRCGVGYPRFDELRVPIASGGVLASQWFGLKGLPEHIVNEIHRRWDAYPDLRRRLAEAAALLRTQEWTMCDHTSNKLKCFWCLQDRLAGHDPDCRLRLFLEALK